MAFYHAGWELTRDFAVGQETRFLRPLTARVRAGGQPRGQLGSVYPLTTFACPPLWAKKPGFFEKPGFYYDSIASIPRSVSVLSRGAPESIKARTRA